MTVYPIVHFCFPTSYLLTEDECANPSLECMSFPHNRALTRIYGQKSSLLTNGIFDLQHQGKAYTDLRLAAVRLSHLLET